MSCNIYHLIGATIMLTFYAVCYLIEGGVKWILRLEKEPMNKK